LLLFKVRKGAEKFVRYYADKIPACMKIEKTTCRNWKCFVVYTDVSTKEYRKIKVLIPDAFISRTTLHTGPKQRFFTTPQTTSIQN